MALRLILGALCCACCILSFAQTGLIIEFGDSVLDPNGDGYVSVSSSGFSGDGYDVDEFEIKMFGIPIFAEGEVINDLQAGENCGVTDLAADTAGYALYAGFDDNENLIFRFRLAGNRPSVESYSILIDTDNLMGNEDPNSNSLNPGFEVEVTLIQGMGVYLYDIDGLDGCPNPLVSYDVATHQQKSTSSLLTCDDEDYFFDFYVPFSDIDSLTEIDKSTEVRFAGVTNTSATCALAGKISDIGGVDDQEYDGCFSCAMLDLVDNQCPVVLDSLCSTCSGFPIGPTEAPVIDKPVLEGDETVSGTAEPEADIFIELYALDDSLKDQDTVQADVSGNWESNLFTSPLALGDSIVVTALLAGKCNSGISVLGSNFAVVSPNESPLITGETKSLQYTENEGVMILDTLIQISDDNTNLAEAVVSISENYIASEDSLVFTDVAGITGSFDGVTGELSFTGSAQLSDYVTLLKSVGYINESEDPNISIRSIIFKVFDGVNWSNNHTLSLLVEKINDPPEFIDDTSTAVDTIRYEINEDSTLTFCLSTFDIEGDSVTLSVIDTVNFSGQLVNLSDPDSLNCWRYTPDENFFGTTYFIYQACDDGVPVACDTLVVEADVLPVNDPPVILINGSEADTLYLNTEVNTTLNVCLNADDIENHNLAFGAIESVNNNLTPTDLGSLCLDIVPDTDYVGTDWLIVPVCDDGSPSLCDTLVIEVGVVPENFAPVIPYDTLSLTTIVNESLEFCVEATDENNDILSVDSIKSEENTGSFSILDTALCAIYIPETDSIGITYHNFIIADNGNPSLGDSVILEVEVLPFNNPPEFQEEGTPVDTLYDVVSENDTLKLCLQVEDIDGDSVSLSAGDTAPLNGTLIISEDSTCFEFVPDPDFVGQDEFDLVTCDDGTPSKCDTLRVIIDVLEVNDPTVITFNGVSTDTLTYSTDENEIIQICIEAFDENNDSLSISSITSQSATGTFTILDSALCVDYSPEIDFSGTTYHNLVICDDGSPVLCDSVILEIKVLPVNDPPQFVDNSSPVDTLFYQVLENDTLGVCTDIFDKDGDRATLSGNSNPSHGQVSIQTDTTCFTYIPAADYFGTDQFELYGCDDGSPSKCDTVVVSVEIVEVNDAPVIVIDGNSVDTLIFTTGMNEALDICVDATDANGDSLFVSEVTEQEGTGTFTILDSALCVNFLPAKNYTGTTYHHLKVCDDGNPALCDSVVLKVFILPPNAPPQFLYNALPADTLYYSMREGTTMDTCVNVDDPDGDNIDLNFLKVLEGSGEFNGTITEAFCFTYKPPPLYYGTDKLLVGICDDGDPQECSSLLIVLTIEPVNDAPQAVNDSVETEALQTIDINVLLNDVDPENEGLLIDVENTESPLNGSVIFLNDSVIQYRSNTGFDGVEQFNYTVCDKGIPEQCVTALVHITVNPVPIKIFEGISPNGDGINEVWIIQGIEHFPDNTVRVFDQWNNLVYEVHGYNNSNIVWNGTRNKGPFKGTLGDGTYYYTIILGNGDKYSGPVVIRR